MTSKEEIEKLSYVLTLHLNDKGIELWGRIKKDLEEKELLESELKLEKHKVKYVMKQLKKQDKILQQLKEILSMDYLVRVYGYDMANKLQAYLKSNDILKEWLEK